MFEVKYDRDGNPIREKARLQEMEQAAQDPEELEAAPQEEPEVQEEQHSEPEEVIEAAPAKETPEPVSTESDAVRNYREMREAKARAERERDDYMRRLAEFESRAKPAEPEPVEEDEELHLGADDIAEGKHLSKVAQKIKKLEAKLAKYESQSTEERTESRLKAKYADFDKVVSRENVALLTEAYPELAQSMHSTTDLYTKAVSAYTLIKKFGIYQESPLSIEREQVTKNVAKPRPLASVSPQQSEQGALSRANAFAFGLTDELKDQLLKEMNSARKGY